MERRVITVFGGSGFIGRQLVRRLAAEGWVVRVAVRDPERAKFLMTAGQPGQVVPLAADVTDAAAAAAAIGDASVVVNMVGILYERGSRTFRRVHVDGAANAAKAAADAGARRFVQVSAIGADRDSPAAYGRTKAAGEEAARTKFPGASIVRPSVVFGPDDDFFNRFAAIARLSPILPVFDMRMQPVFVGDVAEAIVRVLDEPSTQGKTYELGGPRVLSYREVMELLLHEIGRKRLLLPTPLSLAGLPALFLQFLPEPPLTPDQLRLLSRDNVVAAGALTFKDLEVSPTSLEAILPTYLRRFRPPTKLRPRSE